MQSLQRASSSLGASSSASPVPSLVRGGRRAPALLRARRVVESRATVRTVASPHERLQSSLDALDAIKASQVNRYAQDTKSCIISIGLTSKLNSGACLCTRRQGRARERERER